LSYHSPAVEPVGAVEIAERLWGTRSAVDAWRKGPRFPWATVGWRWAARVGLGRRRGLGPTHRTSRPRHL